MYAKNWIPYGAIVQVQTGRPYPLWHPLSYVCSSFPTNARTHYLLAVITRHRQSWHQLRISAGPLHPISTGGTITWRANHLAAFSFKYDCLSTFSSSGCCYAPSTFPSPPSLNGSISFNSSFHQLISTTRSGLHGGDLSRCWSGQLTLNYESPRVVQAPKTLRIHHAYHL